MAAYRRVYDSRHLQADCKEPRSAPGTLRLAIEYGLALPLLFTRHGSELGRLVLKQAYSKWDYPRWGFAN